MHVQRIKIGFHRIGAVAAFVCGVPGAISAVVSLAAYGGWIPNADPELWQILLGSGLFGLVLAVAAYSAARALGWIIAGFVGDTDRPDARMK